LSILETRRDGKENKGKSCKPQPSEPLHIGKSPTANTRVAAGDAQRVRTLEPNEKRGKEKKRVRVL
jgi:hypothetical protein